MGSGEPWKLVDRLKGFNWLNYDGGKFSTSGKRGIFMDAALEVAPADVWRYYLIANAPESADSNFTWEHFAGVVNKDLADVLGNFVLRVTKFCAARFDGKLPGEGAYGDEEKSLIAEMDRRIGAYTDYLEAADFRKAMGELRAIWVAGNEYLTRAAPWTQIKTDRDRAAVGVRMGLNLVHLFTHLTWPVMPELAKKMHLAIQPIGGYAGAGGEVIIPWPSDPMAQELDDLTPGQTITPPEVLVTKITDEQVEELKIRFGGA
jgi:methionyl-tRNA synthetase